MTCTLADWARFVRANMKDPPERVVFHVGSNDRNFAAVRIFPSRGVAVLVAVNAGGERAALAARRAVEALAAMDR